MSTKKIVFANWKMNLDRESIAIFLEELLNLKQGCQADNVFQCPFSLAYGPAPAQQALDFISQTV